MTRRAPERPGFVVCHRGALGDFVLTWPALSCLRRLLPGHRFVGIGRLSYMRLAVSLGFLDASHDMEAAGMWQLLLGRAIPPVLGTPDGAVLWLAEGQEVVDLLTPSASLPVLAIPPFPTQRLHVARYHCLAMQPHFPITIPADLAQCFPPRPPQDGYVLIHPGSGSPKKNYALQFYLQVAEEVQRRGHPRVGFVVGPAEEQLTAADLADAWCVRPADVEALARLLAGAALYIGNDSGVSHLAGALGVPTIALYKTTDPQVWGVVGRRVVHLSAPDEDAAWRQIQVCLVHVPIEKGWNSDCEQRD